MILNQIGLPPMKSTKQITIQLPSNVIDAAKKKAKATARKDGLKQTVTATIRNWIIEAAEKDVAQQ